MLTVVAGYPQGIKEMINQRNKDDHGISVYAVPLGARVKGQNTNII